MSQSNQQKPHKPKGLKANKGPGKYIRFAAVGFQMGGTIFLGNLLGEWLDTKFNKEFWGTTITLIAVFISIYLVISQVIKVSKEDD